MVAPNPSTPAETPPDDPLPSPRRTRSALLLAARSLAKAAQLQKEILTLKAQILAKKLVLSAILATGIVLAGLVGLVFTYIFTFQLLTDIAHIPAVWVWLIFAGWHVLAAAVMGLVVSNIWRERKSANSARSSAAEARGSSQPEAHP